MEFIPENPTHAHILTASRFGEYIWTWPDFATHRKTEGLGQCQPIILVSLVDGVPQGHQWGPAG